MIWDRLTQNWTHPRRVGASTPEQRALRPGGAQVTGSLFTREGLQAVSLIFWNCASQKYDVHKYSSMKCSKIVWRRCEWGNLDWARPEFSTRRWFAAFGVNDSSAALWKSGCRLTAHYWEWSFQTFEWKRDQELVSSADSIFRANSYSVWTLECLSTQNSEGILQWTNWTSLASNRRCSGVDVRFRVSHWGPKIRVQNALRLKCDSSATYPQMSTLKNLVRIIVGHWFLIQEMCRHRHQWHLPQNAKCNSSIWSYPQILGKVGSSIICGKLPAAHWASC